MAYAQTKYGETQGINGKYPISAIGCFLTSFCNLEAGFGNSVDPATLNNFFVQHGVYIDIDDGVRDDLDWGFVQRWDVNTRVVQIGSGGWPQSNNAIVKFAYVHNGQHETHFSKVADYANQMILDSWDGVVKHISATWYGQPVAWAIYEHGAPQTAAPVVPTITHDQLNQLYQDLLGRAPDQSGIDHYVGHYTYDFVQNDIKNSTEYKTRQERLNTPPPTPYTPPAAPQPVVLAEKYTLPSDALWYDSAMNAKTDTDAKGSLPAGEYYVWAKDTNCYNLSTSNVKDEQHWVNTKRLLSSAVVSQETPSPAVVIAADTSLPPVNADKSWKATIEWFHPDHSPDKYEALRSTTISDLNGVAVCNLPVYINDKVKAYGKVEKDDIVYYLVHVAKDVHYTDPKSGKQYFVSADPNWQYCYAIPFYDKYTGKPMLKKESLLEEVTDEIPDILNDIATKTRHEIELAQAEVSKIAQVKAMFDRIGVGKVWDIVVPYYEKVHNKKGVK